MQEGLVSGQGVVNRRRVGVLGGEPVVDGDDLGTVRRPTCEARSAAWKASSRTYTPPWKYRTTWRGSIPSTVISAVGTPPSVPAVTVTSAGGGCAEASSRIRRRCSLTSLSAERAFCRRTASRFSRCSALTEGLPSMGLVWQRSQAGSSTSIAAGKCPAGWRTTARLAAGQVRRRHRITVIRVTRAPQNRSTTAGVNVLVAARFCRRSSGIPGHWARSRLASAGAVATPSCAGGGVLGGRSGPGRSRVPPMMAPAAKMPAVHQNAVS